MSLLSSEFRLPCETLCPLWLVFLFSKISARSFLHHGLQRHMMLGGDAPAVFILGRIIRDGPVHACDLDANLAPFDADIFPTSGQGLTSLVASPNTESGRLAEDQLRQFVGILGCTKNGQQRSRTALLHLH